MKQSIRVMSLFIAAFFLSVAAEATNLEETESLLKEALMESNGDYNKHKKKANYEEMDRADSWADRQANTITLSTDIMAHGSDTSLKAVKDRGRGVSSQKNYK